ncbi:hypothetical protein [Halobaculum gomorrense]|uniref:Uncharacterized protein n=1 Tax=Halobaculum gomorrense TaxID=43928 RepID=A0A1M5MML6_9EURY|nr:hypothetical protein [Halobaculum gomorrense]SHG78437.1 hypothetical protein SAMN05443636_1065 [Halobaculum gomorrense]
MTEAVGALGDPVSDDGHHALQWLGDGEEQSHRSFAAALDGLRAQQRHLQRSLEAGFASRREVLEWSHAVDVVAAGQTPDEWHFELLTDRWEVACLLEDDDARAAVSADVPDARGRRSVRQRVRSRVLTPSYQRALSTLRERVGENTDEEGVQNATTMRWVGARPRLHQRAVEQHRALRTALSDGRITGYAAVADWAEEIVHVTEGHVDDEFAARATARSGDWYHALVNGPSVRLEWLLAQEVLPAMNDLLATVATDANERAMDTVRVREEPPSG